MSGEAGAESGSTPKFCMYCGAPLTPGAQFCISCGKPVSGTAPPPASSYYQQSQASVQGQEEISLWWWLLPIFLSWIGGLIAYFVLRHRNPRTATRMLILGIVLTIIAVVIVAAIGYYAFSTIIGSGQFAGVTVSGQVVVPAGSGAGIVILSLRNLSNNPVVGFNVTSITPSVGGVAGTFVMKYDGGSLSQNGVSSGTTIPAGDTGTGEVSASSLSVQDTYAFAVWIYFQSGVTQVQTVYITAQL